MVRATALSQVFLSACAAVFPRWTDPVPRALPLPFAWLQPDLPSRPDPA